MPVELCFKANRFLATKVRLIPGLSAVALVVTVVSDIRGKFYAICCCEMQVIHSFHSMAQWHMHTRRIFRSVLCIRLSCPFRSSNSTAHARMSLQFGPMLCDTIEFRSPMAYVIQSNFVGRRMCGVRIRPAVESCLNGINCV